jgi:putative oxidoreductase
MPSWLFSLPNLADPALLILRLAVGGMFAMSGYFKLTYPSRKQKMAESLSEAGVPTTLTPLISALELIGGLLVVFGLWTVLGCALLIVVSIGALVTTAIPKAEGQGIHKFENIIYTPEAIIGASLLVLLAIGAGRWSIDAVLR